MDDSEDPDQMDHQEPVDLDIHCFLKKIYLGSAGKGFRY